MAKIVKKLWSRGLGRTVVIRSGFSPNGTKNPVEPHMPRFGVDEGGVVRGLSAEEGQSLGPRFKPLPKKGVRRDIVSENGRVNAYGSYNGKAMGVSTFLGFHERTPPKLLCPKPFIDLGNWFWCSGVEELSAAFPDAVFILDGARYENHTVPPLLSDPTVGMPDALVIDPQPDYHTTITFAKDLSIDEALEAYNRLLSSTNSGGTWDPYSAADVQVVGSKEELEEMARKWTIGLGSLTGDALREELGKLFDDVSELAQIGEAVSELTSSIAYKLAVETSQLEQLFAILVDVGSQGVPLKRIPPSGTRGQGPDARMFSSLTSPTVAGVCKRAEARLVMETCSAFFEPKVAYLRSLLEEMSAEYEEVAAAEAEFGRDSDDYDGVYSEFAFHYAWKISTPIHKVPHLAVAALDIARALPQRMARVEENLERSVEELIQEGKL